MVVQAQVAAAGDDDFGEGVVVEVADGGVAVVEAGQVPVDAAVGVVGGAAGDDFGAAVQVEVGDGGEGAGAGGEEVAGLEVVDGLPGHAQAAAPAQAAIGVEDGAGDDDFGGAVAVEVGQVGVAAVGAAVGGLGVEAGADPFEGAVVFVGQDVVGVGAFGLVGGEDFDDAVAVDVAGGEAAAGVGVAGGADAEEFVAVVAADGAQDVGGVEPAATVFAAAVAPGEADEDDVGGVGVVDLAVVVVVADLDDEGGGEAVAGGAVVG